MKARSFFISLAATVLVLLSVALALVWAVGRQSPLNLVGHPLVLPRTAQFAPRTGAISFHLMVDPDQLPSFAEAVASSGKRKSAGKEVGRIRDGIFALAGLDFQDELAEWIGSELSLTLYKSDPDEAKFEWVLALGSDDQEGVKRFLQSFWQTRSLAGIALETSKYRNIGIISGRRALLGDSSQTISTALINNDLVLLASHKSAIEKSLDASQFPDENQLENEELGQISKTFGVGEVFLTASPDTLHSWFGLPSELSSRKDIKDLVSSIKFKGKDIEVEGKLRFNRPIAEFVLKDSLEETLPPLLNFAGGDAESLALLTSPSKLLDIEDNHPISQWIRPLLLNQLSSVENSFSAKTIFALDQGPLLWLQQGQGWFLVTTPNQPSPEKVGEVLAGQGYIKSELDSDSGHLAAWTRLVAKRNRINESLDTEVEVVLADQPERVRWASNLSVFQEAKKVNNLQPRLNQIKALGRKEDLDQNLQMMVFSASPGMELLRNWRPWVLFQTVAGKSLDKSVQGLSFDLSEDIEESIINFRALLNLG